MAATTDTQTDTFLGHDSPLGLVLNLNSDLEFGRIYVSEERLSGLGWPRMQSPRANFHQATGFRLSGGPRRSPTHFHSVPVGPAPGTRASPPSS
jgi:hypothetical protein